MLVVCALRVVISTGCRQNQALVDSSCVHDQDAVLLEQLVFLYPHFLDSYDFDQCYLFSHRQTWQQQTSAEDFVFWYAIHGFWFLHIHIWCSSYSVHPITMSINLKARILSKNTKQAIKKRLVFLCQGSTVELNRVSFRNMSQIFVGSTIKTYSLKMISNKIFLIRDIWTSSRLIAQKKRVIVKLSKETILRRQGWQMKFFAPS